MCELFGVSSEGKVRVKEYLDEFFSHSESHPNGWGIAQFYDNSVSLEKEPLKAVKSAYLRERLRRIPETSDMIAHIRFATRGADEYENTHPFVRRDSFDRAWTFAHNGTVFNAPQLDGYYKIQEGGTDSERILLYFADKINAKQSASKRSLNSAERFDVIDRAVCELAEGNKLNFLLYDGEVMYVHCNFAGTLFSLKKENATIFSTVPLSGEDWNPVEFTTLLAYKRGKLFKKGTNHGKEYKLKESDMKLLFVDYSSL